MTIHAHINQDNLDTVDQPLAKTSNVKFGRISVGALTSGKFAVGDTTGAEAVDIQQLNDVAGASNANIWQSFKPVTSGLLSQASLKLTTATTDVRIYEGEGVGGTLLNTESSVSFIDAGTVTTFAISKPTPVLAGQTYTIEAAGTQFARYDPGNPYADGRSGISAGIDLVFEIYITPYTADLIVDENGNVGVGIQDPQSPVHIGSLPTQQLQVDDAGTTSATEQSWIEVQVNGVTGFIRVFATK